MQDEKKPQDGYGISTVAVVVVAFIAIVALLLLIIAQKYG